MEQSGETVQWQDPCDRKAIAQLIQQELLGTVATNMQTNYSQVGGSSSSRSEANPMPISRPLPLGKQHLVNLLDAEGGGGTIHWTEPHHREMAINARLDEFQQQALNTSTSNDGTNYGILDEWPELSQELANIMEDVDDVHNDQNDDDDDVHARHFDDLAIDKRRMRGPLP